MFIGHPNGGLATLQRISLWDTILREQRRALNLNFFYLVIALFPFFDNNKDLFYCYSSIDKTNSDFTVLHHTG
jgi:hypothetical protein